MSVDFALFPATLGIQEACQKEFTLLDSANAIGIMVLFG